MAREITDKQHRLLDRIADRAPQAIVTGWSNEYKSPIITHPDGRRTVARTSGREADYDTREN